MATKEDMPRKATELLLRWLIARLTPEERSWLEPRLQSDQKDAEVFRSFALAPRRLGKEDLNLTEAELAQARALRPGWVPGALSLSQAARLLLLLSASTEDFLRRFEKIVLTADVGEQVTLFRGLPIYPVGDQLLPFAQEALRGNIRSVFEAVAHDNPYPAEHFDEGAWNQMVLKALFIGSYLHPIQGLDRRANPELAGMLQRTAHERRAAGRAVSPELWRCVGPFADESALEDLERALAGTDEWERQGAALALLSTPNGKRVLAKYPTLAEGARTGAFDWNSLYHTLSQVPLP